MEHITATRHNAYEWTVLDKGNHRVVNIIEKPLCGVCREFIQTAAEASLTEQRVTHSASSLLKFCIPPFEYMQSVARLSGLLEWQSRLEAVWSRPSLSGKRPDIRQMEKERAFVCIRTSIRTHREIQCLRCTEFLISCLFMLLKAAHTLDLSNKENWWCKQRQGWAKQSTDTGEDLSHTATNKGQMQGGVCWITLKRITVLLISWNFNNTKI